MLTLQKSPFCASPSASTFHWSTRKCAPGGCRGGLRITGVRLILLVIQLVDTAADAPGRASEGPPVEAIALQRTTPRRAALRSAGSWTSKADLPAEDDWQPRKFEPSKKVIPMRVQRLRSRPVLLMR